MRVLHSIPNPNRSVVKLELADGSTRELYLEASVPLSTNADCWLYLLLPICMQLGEDLAIAGKVTQSALHSFENLKKELLRGHPKMKDIALKYDLDAIINSPEKQDRTGLFFSGGLDSTYASEMQPEIDTLVSVWGFDIPIKNEKHWNLTTALLEAYTKDLSRKLILMKTNIREMSNGLLEWGGDYHGTALSGIANSLSKQLGTVYVAAGFIRQKPNWGHSPILYNASTTDYQSIIETDPVLRIAKAAAMSDNPRTEMIRACYRNVSGLANCGTCKKCVRTRLEFALVNAKYRPERLDVKPRVREYLNSRLTKWDYLFYLEALTWARKHGFKGTIKPLLVVTITRIKSMIQTWIEKNRVD